MPSSHPVTLRIGRASAEQRLAAYRNVHDVWSGGLPMEQHLARRCASPQHNRALWYVGCVDDQVVASLACYPLEFNFHGQRYPGIAIGSVHTRSDWRGHGFAPQLIGHVEQVAARTGAQLSLLYSDIDPGYYARLGYVPCPAWRSVRQLDEPRPSADGGVASAAEDSLLPQSTASSDWQLLNADQCRDELIALYHGWCQLFPLSIARPTEYWNHLRVRRPHDLFLGHRSITGQLQAYLRASIRNEALSLVDLAWSVQVPDQTAIEASLYGAAVAFARQQGCRRLEGWVGDTPLARRWFRLEPRTMEITMVRSLTPELALDQAALAGCHAFAELDHV